MLSILRAFIVGKGHISTDCGSGLIIGNRREALGRIGAARPVSAFDVNDTDLQAGVGRDVGTGGRLAAVPNIVSRHRRFDNINTRQRACVGGGLRAALGGKEVGGVHGQGREAENNRQQHRNPDENHAVIRAGQPL